MVIDLSYIRWCRRMPYHQLGHLKFLFSSEIVQSIAQMYLETRYYLIIPFLLPAASVFSPKNSTAKQLLLICTVGTRSCNRVEIKIISSPPTAKILGLYRLMAVQNKDWTFLGCIIK